MPRHNGHSLSCIAILFFSSIFYLIIDSFLHRLWCPINESAKVLFLRKSSIKVRIVFRWFWWERFEEKIRLSCIQPLIFFSYMCAWWERKNKGDATAKTLTYERLHLRLPKSSLLTNRLFWLCLQKNLFFWGFTYKTKVDLGLRGFKPMQSLLSIKYFQTSPRQPLI